MHLFTFRYKQELDSEGIPRLGLFAEEEEKLNPDLVTGDVKGKAYAVRYDAVIAMLLDELIKEHRAVEELNRKIQQQDMAITQLKKEMEIVVTYLKEHSKIQKWAHGSKRADLHSKRSSRAITLGSLLRGEQKTHNPSL